ncbi:MAG TPA: hypothetical protein VLQ93_02820 [Myxococcaceae bacterium]|nr:hypothetical protein [Myxococcaceae bacterium]
MSDPASRPSPNLLARTLKLVGHLTSPETRPGRVFEKAERGLTKVAARLAESPTWLRVSGGLMRRGFTLQVRRTRVVEKALHTLRVPTSSEVDVMRDQLRRMGDQVEALGSQLELVVELLERQEQQAAPSTQATDTGASPRRKARVARSRH